MKKVACKLLQSTIGIDQAYLFAGPDVHVGSEQSPQEDNRTDVFRKIKSSDKSTSRYQIHDDR